MSKVNIIGAGLSGISCAVKLLSLPKKFEVSIFEASDRAGGRLKNFYSPVFDQNFENPHLISKANKNALNFLKIIGQETIEAANFKTSSYNPLSLYRLFVESVSNTSYENANKRQSMALFAKALSSGFKFYHASFDTFIPKSISFIENHGGKFYFNHKINSIYDFDKEDITVIATDAINFNRLCESSYPTKEKPIVNIHFKYDLKKDFVLLCPDFSFPCVIFSKNGMLSITVSSAFRLINYKNENIANIFLKLIKNLFNLSENVIPWTVTKSKRATVNMENLRKKDLNNNNRLFFCADFLDCLLPPTIESAISSGFDSGNAIYEKFN